MLCLCGCGKETNPRCITNKNNYFDESQVNVDYVRNILGGDSH